MILSNGECIEVQVCDSVAAPFRVRMLESSARRLKPAATRNTNLVL